MRPLPALPLTVLTALAVAVPASAAVRPGQRVPRDAAAAAALARQAQAIDLLNKATRQVRDARKACDPEPGIFAPKPSLSTAPDPALVAILAPLRRPATPDELTLFTSQDGQPRLSPPGALYSNFVRRVTTTNGRVVTIAIAQQTPSVITRPANCRTEETTRLHRLLAGQPTQIKATALRYLRSSHREEARAVKRPTFDGLFSFESDGSSVGSGGGGSSAARFARYGNFLSSGSRTGAEVTGVVPDGVAAVRFDYPRQVGRGRYYKPVAYPKAIRRTVRVQDNVLDFHVARGAEDALPRHMTWLAADGSVLRVVTND